MAMAPPWPVEALQRFSHIWQLSIVRLTRKARITPPQSPLEMAELWWKMQSL